MPNCRLSRHSTREAPRSIAITGASRGLGAAFARAASPASDLLLAGRDEASLDRLASDLAAAGRRVETCVGDLTEQDVRAAFVARCEAMEIDLLVNNAGVGSYGAFLARESDAHAQTIALNVAALTELTHALLPGMLARAQAASARAGLINVASSAAFLPIPTMAVYGATKAFVLSFTEALAAELEDEPLDVLAFCPGATRTEFGTSAGFSRAHFPGAMAADRAADEALRALGRQTTLILGPVGGTLFRPAAIARNLVGRGIMQLAKRQSRFAV